MDDAHSIPLLPDDPAALKAIVLSITRQRDEWKQKHDLKEQDRLRLEQDRLRLEQARQQMEVEKLRLEMELLRLKKLYYGPRADRLAQSSDLAQMLLEFAGQLESRPVNPSDLPPGSPPADADSKTARRVSKGRRNLAAFNHLPVTRQVHDLPEDQKPCPCCQTPRQKIGQETSWQVEYVPGHFERIEHVRIRRLYAIEERGREQDVPDRLALRQQESMPILTTLKDKLHAWRQTLLPKHPMTQAVGYALNQWTELNVFVSDGAVPIDNNISEREMKRVVLNRKNSLFVGNDRGGRTAAILSSFTSTCRRHGVDPQHYFTQLLTNLPATPMSQLDQWLPDQWKNNQVERAK
jgi:hypothetical protein